MRVVEYQKSTESLTFQVVRGLGWVAGIFSLVVCILMIANNLSLKKTDPIHSPTLQKLIEDLKTDPKNESLRQEIRDLDMIARRAFFTSQRFNRMAVYLLVGGLSVMIIAFKAQESFRTTPPYPNSSDPKDNLVENAMWARKAVTAVGLVLVGFALMIALPWESTLDVTEEALAAAAAAATADNTPPSQPSSPSDEPATPAPAVKSATPPAASPSPSAAASKPIATAEERLKNWPILGGANGRISSASGLPASWDGAAGTGVKWKTKIPLPGFSSPIFWDGKLFVTGGDATTREVYCIESASGKILWQKKVENVPGSSAEPAKVAEDTGYASGTMVTDGVRAFAIFANGDLAAFDMQGNAVWSKSIGIPDNPYGYASSLAIHEDTLIVQFDQEKDSYLGGFDVATGAERWKTQREFGPSWSTPTVANTGERVEIIVAGEPTVASYDPKTGEELWRVDCLEHGEVASMPVYADGIVFVSADAAKLSAIDLKTQKILWENNDLKPGVSTPLAHEGLLYCGTDDGALVCYDAKTGEEVWAEFADDGFYASPILADGRLYLLDRAGNMHILKPGRTYELIGKMPLGEAASTTAAVVGDSLYLRGIENLYRIAP